MSEKKLVMLIDGMALLFRGFYATPVFRTTQGVPINAITQWIKYFLHAVDHFNPSHVVCCWDMGAKTFRSELSSAYKANRSEAPDDLIPQFNLIKQVIEEGFRIPNVGVVGYEGDDIIGTLSKLYCEHMDVIILTGDHDNLQLVSERVKVAIMKKGLGNYKIYSPNVLMEEKGITPRQFIDVKAIMGDTSDNIAGVKGIGEVGALKLIKQYRDIEGILDNLSLLTPSMRKKIENDLQSLHLSRNLATIKCDVPLEHDMETSSLTYRKEQLQQTFEKYELKILMNTVRLDF
jgi:5'-3' exonuclease